jgi:lipopolysaccharide transport system ATP-binding protein
VFGFMSKEAPLREQPLIRLSNVSKRFALRREVNRSFQQSFIRLMQGKRDPRESFWALRDVSFEVMRGDCFGIIGPNGSGKSTLLKLITGILEPTEGAISISGRVASLLELGAGFHPDLTGRENIYLNGSVYGLNRRQMESRIDDIIEYAELGDFIDVPIKHYSSGMYVRLGFAVATHSDPDILIVDEVLAVGDVAFQHKCLDSIQHFRNRGGTLVFVSHDLSSVQALCNNAVWLDHGRVKASGSPLDVSMSYVNHVADETQAKAGTQGLAETAHGQRWGSGQVEVISVVLCDGAGRERVVFATGQPLEIQLNYRIHTGAEEPVFGLAVHDQNGVHICGPNTEFGGLRIPATPGYGRVIYRVPNLSLLEGAYLLSVAAVNGLDNGVYDYHDRAYQFRVTPGRERERYGVITLNGTWSTHKLAEERPVHLVGAQRP